MDDLDDVYSLKEEVSGKPESVCVDGCIYTRSNTSHAGEEYCFKNEENDGSLTCQVCASYYFIGFYLRICHNHIFWEDSYFEMHNVLRQKPIKIFPLYVGCKSFKVLIQHFYLLEYWLCCWQCYQSSRGKSCSWGPKHKTCIRSGCSWGRTGSGRRS